MPSNIPPKDMYSGDRIAAFAACISILLVLSGPAYAGIEVSGSIIKEEVSAGQPFSFQIGVSSKVSDDPLNFSVGILGFNQSPRGDSIEVAADEDFSPYSARPFLKASPDRFYLAPGGHQDITLEGTIPEDAGEGGRYAIVRIASDPTGNGTVGVSLAVEVPVLLTISGTELTKRGEVEGLMVANPPSKGAQNITLIFKNTGNIHYRASAQATLLDSSGNVLANSTIPSISSILPGSTRIYEIILKPAGDLKAGVYTIDSKAVLEDGTVLGERKINLTA